MDVFMNVEWTVSTEFQRLHVLHEPSLMYDMALPITWFHSVMVNRWTGPVFENTCHGLSRLFCAELSFLWHFRRYDTFGFFGLPQMSYEREFCLYCGKEIQMKFWVILIIEKINEIWLFSIENPKYQTCSFIIERFKVMLKSKYVSNKCRILLDFASLLRMYLKFDCVLLQYRVEVYLCLRNDYKMLR